MRYSLRSLMIVVTLICVVLGGRIEYLRRMAAHHQREAEKFAMSFGREWNAPRFVVDEFEAEWVKHGIAAMSSVSSDGTTYDVAITPGLKQMHHHRRLASLFRQAVYHPWTRVDETFISHPWKEVDETLAGATP